MEGKHPACRVVSSMASCMPKNCIVVKKHFTQTDTHSVASFPGQLGKPEPERLNQSEF